MNMLDHALAYAQAGIPVFPLHTPVFGGGPNPGNFPPHVLCSCGNPHCTRVGKHPRTPNGLRDATTSQTQIREWFKKWPDANIGIPTGQTSGIIVIDADGPDAVRWVIEQMLPLTLTATTGKGVHLYYKAPQTRKVRNSAGKLAKNVDVRGDGGYVVAPPSLHRNGERYRWADAAADASEGPSSCYNPLSDTGYLAILPLAILGDSDRHTETISDGSPISAGQRNDALTSLAGTMRRYGWSQVAIEAALLAENNRRCKPPLPHGEVRKIAKSVSRYGPSVDILRLAATPTQEIRLLARDDLDQLPRPDWLIEKHIVKNSLGVIYGKSNVGKTFMALDMALSIAAGKPFMDKWGIDPGYVVYLAAEGATGLAPRVAAWEKHYHKRAERLYVIPQAVQLMEPEQVVLLLETLDTTFDSPKMVVIDTLARCMVGGEENSATDMGIVVAHADKIRDKTGAAVILIHHAGKDGTEERGSTALRGAVDTMFSMYKETEESEIVQFNCKKQKDFEPTKQQSFRLHKIDDSCVLLPTNQPISNKTGDAKNLRKL